VTDRLGLSPDEAAILERHRAEEHLRRAGELARNLDDALDEFRRGIGTIPLIGRLPFVYDWWCAHINEKRARAIRDLAEALRAYGDVA
jgi:hypothetical protein